MTESARAHVRVLGPVELTVGHAPSDLAPGDRRLLAALALWRPDWVDRERLIDALWPTDRPRTARQSLHNRVLRLRQAMGPDAVERIDDRYRLSLHGVAVDADEVRSSLHAADQAIETRRFAEALDAADQALSRWRGTPFSALDGIHEAEVEQLRLVEIRSALEDIRARALIELGNSGAAIAELERLVNIDPRREQRWVLLMEALHGAGRRGDALAAFSRARRVLADQLGLGPGRDLVAAEQRVLEDDGSSPVATDTSHATGRSHDVEAVVRAHDGGAHLVVLTGEMGVGKTTVLSDVGRVLAARGCTVVSVDCEDNAPSPLQPLADVASELADRVGAPAVPGVLDQLQLVAASSAAPQAPGRPASMLDALVDALVAIDGAVGGLVLQVDDLHHAGPTTQRVLAALAGVGVVHVVAATSQPQALTSNLLEAASPIPLAGLDLAATVDLGEQLLGSALGPAGPWLHELSGGNPLFVTELLSSLRRTGSLRREGDGFARPDAVEVPPAITELVRRRLQALGDRTRRALDAAAVLGMSFDRSVLGELAPSDGIDAAVTVGLLQPQGTDGLRFTHGLFRQVLIDQLSRGRLLELHHAAAIVLESGGGSTDVIASHRMVTAEIDPRKTVAAARAAGDRAEAQHAFEEAASWYARAAEVETTGHADPVVLADLRVRSANALRLAGVPGHVDALLDAASAAAALPDREVRVRGVLAALELGETSESGHANQAATALADQVLEIEDDPATRAVICAAATLVHSMSSRSDRCRELWAEADAISRRLADPVVRAQVLPYAYLSLGHPDHLDQRDRAATELIDLGEQLGDPIAEFEGWHLSASVGMQRGDGDRLRKSHDRLGQLLDSLVADAGRRWAWHYVTTAVAHLEGRLDDADRWADATLSASSGIAGSRGLAVYSAQLIDLRRAQGRLHELEDAVAALVADQPELRAWHAAAALVFSGTDPDRARAHFDEVARDDFSGLPRDFTWLPSVHVAGRAAATLGDVERIEAAEVALSPYADQCSFTGSCTYGPVAVVLARLAGARGDSAERRRCALRGLEIARRLDAGLFVTEAEALLV